MGTDDVKRLRTLEQENGRLKKILAERDLEIEVMKEITAKKWWACRLDWPKLANLFAIERGVSQRRACALLQVSWSGLTYTCKMPNKDAPIVQAMRHYSAKYPRFGARRVRIFLRRDGMALGRDRTAQIWAQYGLQVPAKKPKKRYRPERTQIGAPSRPNEVWRYDFVFDACANGQKLKCLTMIDEFTKESLFIDAAGSIRGNRVVEVLELVAS